MDQSMDQLSISQKINFFAKVKLHKVCSTAKRVLLKQQKLNILVDSKIIYLREKEFLAVQISNSMEFTKKEKRLRERLHGSVMITFTNMMGALI